MPNTRSLKPASKQTQLATPQRNRTPRQIKADSDDEVRLRTIAFYIVAAMFSVSEVGSFVAFLITKNLEAVLLYQLPAFFFYRILCHLFPANGSAVSSFLTFLQQLWRHKP